MTHKRNLALRLAAIAVAGAGLTACSAFEKKTPDEFAVVTKAPLVLPPDYSLRPPKPGAKRPQEQPAAETARAALFPNSKGLEQRSTPGEEAFLAKAGASGSDAEIEETKTVSNDVVVKKSDDFTNRLLFGKPGDTPTEKAVPASAATAKADDKAEADKKDETEEEPAAEADGETGDEDGGSEDEKEKDGND